MSDTTSASPFAAPPAGGLIVVDLDPRRQLAHRAIAGYLAGYSGATLDAYRLDLRQWVTWLDGNGVGILDAQRAHIELYARWSEEHGLARSTISRRLSAICGFYRYCSAPTRSALISTLRTSAYAVDPPTPRIWATSGTVNVLRRGAPSSGNRRLLLDARSSTVVTRCDFMQ